MTTTPPIEPPTTVEELDAYIEAYKDSIYVRARKPDGSGFGRFSVAEMLEHDPEGFAPLRAQWIECFHSEGFYPARVLNAEEAAEREAEVLRVGGSLVDELERAGSFGVRLTVTEWFSVVAALQVACRHPRIPPRVVATVKTLVSEIQSALRDPRINAPKTAAVIDAGWDPQKDLM